MDVFPRFIVVIILQILAFQLFAQRVDSIPVLDFEASKNYEIGAIKVSGAIHTEEKALLAITGLRVGDQVQIPGKKISTVIKALWKLRLFDDVQIIKEKTIGDVVFLEIIVQESPRYSIHTFNGVKKTLHDDLNSLINQHLVKGSIVSENDNANSCRAIENYFIGKGYLDTRVEIVKKPDSTKINAVQLKFVVGKRERIKIKDIAFTGNAQVKDKKLRRLMSGTRQKKHLFSSSKFISDDFESDKRSIVQYYNTLGHRDARIVEDSIWRNIEGELMIQLTIEEGSPYYFRNIFWKGNSEYDSKVLSDVLGIQKGDIFNTELLKTRLHFGEDGRDITSMYMDRGFLFFKVEPIENSITNDSVDLEIRIFEGARATIDKVIIKGNDRTNEHVIRRELRTKPGSKFSRSDIIRSQREIINLGYFNPERLGINTPVNAQNGTVDIEYIVEERPSDQLELSAGWGGGETGVIGTLGVTFNNFSLRNIWNKETWNPLPQGDGQKVSLRAQSNGQAYQSYNFSINDPWLGGKKPTSFTVAGVLTRYTNGLDNESPEFGKFSILGGNASIGTRLTFPDDNFISTTAVNLQKYSLQNWASGLFRTDDGILVSEGDYYNFSIAQTLTRSTINNPLFPTEGSKFSLSLQLTPPYSLLSNKSVDDLEIQEQFKFLEYHKWKFDAEWYTTLVGKLVLKAKAKFGFLGRYNNELSISPFERFQLGGNGLSNQQVGYTGTDIISLRGYEATDLTNNLVNGELVAAPLYNKFTLELRYPITLNPNSTIYGLAFLEGGNSWQNYKDFNPFDMKRSAGVGLRVFLPMFGLLGLDYGLGFDKDGEHNFSNFGKLSFILGFEPE